jgi:zinc and cadmium transporter
MSGSSPSAAIALPAEWRVLSGSREINLATIAWISAATVAGGAISLAIAALFALSAPASWVPALVSLAIGTLLGAAFLEILPHAIENTEDFRLLFGTVLAGILGFFVLEKLVLWRHVHIEDYEAHDHASPTDHGRSGLMITVGDSFHNFVDGILIAAAFLQSTELGVVTAIAIIAHEIPQEIGDFLVLLNSGYSRMAALALNLLSSLAMLVGALLAYFTLRVAEEWISTVLALAGASMIYVAVADLIPGLHRRTELHATAQQVALIGVGVALIWLVGNLVGAR